ncbi:prephenate dehydratase [Alteribacillus bidgolensis]|uniref:Prephenate dehydratase n=1 Tax=Alteribacillus bidgolensis TaxID=930129 RepID=A0A1G8N5Q5_9BACI|nr:prephenate dehydratase [Alteribacillus bidgolensis]SDI75619.1 prephenate dehydratase [Alteribacillus bidgolensis]
MTKKVGYLGPEGSFTEAAAKAVLPDNDRYPYSTIPSCMAAAAKSDIDIAVVPLENAIEGSVNMTLDYLIHKHDLPIIGEITVPIEQHLMVHPAREKDWKDVSNIYSHPQAIAQCDDFINNNLPNAKIHYTNSTSSAAKDISEHPGFNGAAIANYLAAEKYGLKIVEQNIHDYDNNHTRFVLLSNKDNKDSFESKENQSGKTTLMITLPSDYSGALHQVLSAFAWRKLNLTKIESRPMKTGIGNYFFIIDVDQDMDDVLIPGVIAELEALGCGVRILGSYPCFLSLSLEVKPILE